MQKISTLLSLVSLLILAAWTLPTNDTWKNKVDADLLDKAARHTSIEFLVIMQAQANTKTAKNIKNKTEKGTFVHQQLRQFAKQSQQNALTILQAENRYHKSFFIINAIHAKGDLNTLEQLARLPEVKYIAKNAPVKLETPVAQEATTSRGPSAIEWGIDNINADDVWALGFRGEGVIIAGQDTGYEWEHPALKSTYRGWDGTAADHNYNWHDAIHEIHPLNIDTTVATANNPCGLDVLAPCDDNNHGTHTMGTMIGEDGENQIGVAPAAKWIACRNMERGWGTPVSYIECYEWFIAPTDLNNENPDPAMAPHVINNSWGCPPVEGCDATNYAIMNMVVDNVKAAGIVVVVSAGNSGSQGCGSVSNPSAIYENSFSIGAIAIDDNITGFSSRGPVVVDGSNRLKPNVSAPGAGVRSAIRNGQYAAFSGTSMAGPHVAGLVALLISANPDLAGQVEEIETIIEQSARPKMTTDACGDLDSLAVPNHTYGFGNVDALAAVEAAIALSSTQNTGVLPSIKVYPNPVQDRLTITIDDLKETTSFQLFNASGQLVLERGLSPINKTENLSMKALPQGIYFYTIKTATQSLQGKIVKQ